METTYSDSGVDIKLGDEASKILYNAAKETWKNRKGLLGEIIVPFDDFSGVRAIDVSNLPKGTLMNMGFDGVGTKMEIAERMNDYSTIAYDLFAMVCDDAVVRGAEPVLIGSILDINYLCDCSIEQIKQLAKGYTTAAKEAGVVIVNGEVAELGDRVSGYGPFNYNWGAAVVWFAKKERLFTGYEIKEGQFLVGLKEEGFRSNGLSLLRKVMLNTYGDDWHNIIYNSEKIGKLALMPSKIYCTAILEMFGGYNREAKANVSGIVHVTGGGIPGKLRRVLKPSGLGAIIDSPFMPCDLMLHTQEKGDVPDDEAYRTWNMGNGMIVITCEPEKVIAIAKAHNIEAKVIGKTTKEKEIKIKNQGFFRKEEWLIF